MNPFPGCVVTIKKTWPRSREWILWSKRGNTCWLVENFASMGPRQETTVEIGELTVVDFVPHNQHARWFK